MGFQLSARSRPRNSGRTDSSGNGIRVREANILTAEDNTFRNNAGGDIPRSEE